MINQKTWEEIQPSAEELDHVVEAQNQHNGLCEEFVVDQEAALEAEAGQEAIIGGD